MRGLHTLITAIALLASGSVDGSTDPHNGPFHLNDWEGECWRGESQKLTVFETCRGRWVGDSEIGVTLNRAPEGVGITVSRTPCGRYYYPKKDGVAVQETDRAEKLNIEIRQAITAAMKATNCSKPLVTKLTAESTEQFLQISDGLTVLPY